MEKPKILIVDDDQVVIDTLVSLCELWNYNFIISKNGSDALIKAKIDKPDAVLLDLRLPDIDGIEVCRKLKIDRETKDIPIIILTGLAGDNSTVLALESGADDYIIKPFNPIVLNARIKSVLRIKKSLDEVFTMSITDSLTGLYNRRYFEMISMDEFYRAERYQSKLSCLMIDIDHFKHVNDSYGHEYGDYVLKQISNILTQIRRTDKVCRWGGEEFIILLPNTSGTEAKICAEHLRQKVENKVFGYENSGFKVTISIGVSSLHEGPVGKPEELIRYADRALYRAKENGRNCVWQITR